MKKNMLYKKRKAFTLIELLAVIVIIGIIGVIAVPNVVNITNSSRRETIENTTRMLAKAAEDYYSYNLVNSSTIFKVSLTDDTLDYRGDKPDSGYAFFDDKGRAYIRMYYDGYCVVRNYDGVIELDKTAPSNCTIVDKSAITLYLNGGKAIYSGNWSKAQDYISTIVDQGSTLDDIPTVEKTGYTFLGWYNDAGEKADLTKVINDNLVLYAKYEINTYTITLDLAGGTTTDGYSTTKKIKYGEVYGSLPNVVKEGYTFSGWTTTGGTIIKENTVLTLASDHTIYAGWIANSYVVTFVYGDDRPNTTKEVTYGSTYGELPTPTMEGYTFKGWYYNNTKVDSTTKVTKASDQVLIALWEANKYTLTFVYNNGSTDTTKEVIYGKTYGELPIPTKTGYIFNGWTTSGGNLINETDKVTITSDTTLYAQYSVDSYLVTFNANGGTVSIPTKNVKYDNAYGTLPTPVRVGYTFTGWYYNNTKIEETTIVSITSNHTLIAKWKANTYKVTLVYNNGTTNEEKEITYDSEYGVLPTPVKEGYTFLGWYTTGGINVDSTTILKNAKDHTLNAQWKANTYIITFIFGNGENNVTKEVIFDSEYGELQTPTRVGYTFKGWYTQNTGGTKIDSTTIVKIASNHNLYARWEANKYIVTFNGEKFDNGTRISFNPVTNEVCSIGLSGYEMKTGCMNWYVFNDEGNNTTVNMILAHNTTSYVAWNENSNGTTPDTVNAKLQEDISTWNSEVKSTARLISASEIAKITGYANWNNNYYYFHNNTSNSYEGISGTNKYAWLFDNTYDCTRYGCNVKADTTYGYWTSDSFGSGSAWSVARTGVLISANITETYNRGVRPVITVSKEKIGGVIKTSREVTYGSAYGELPVSSKSNRVFDGWYTTGGVKISSTTLVSMAMDHTLYGQWKKNIVVRFDATGGSTSIDSINVIYGGKYGTLPTPTRDGYVFNGWYTTSGVKIDATSEVKYSSNHVLYAEWTQVGMNYAYTGSSQEYTVQNAGYYRLEVWGAQGGDTGGNGGYSTGDIYLTAGTKLYIYVGGSGDSATCSNDICPGGFNGGGYRHKYKGGGGATDIRVNSDSLYSRVIVAGGGGSGIYGGVGGGENGGSIKLEWGYANLFGRQTYSGQSINTTATSQIKTAQLIIGNSSLLYKNSYGGFGFGGVGNGYDYDTESTEANYYNGAGGGGWYGGRGNYEIAGVTYAAKGGGGGSGYVYTDSTYQNYPSGCLLNSNYYLINAYTMAGDLRIPAISGNSTEIGNEGNGKAKITYLGTTISVPPRIIVTLDASGGSFNVKEDYAISTKNVMNDNATKLFSVGENYNNLLTPERYNYKFLGWYTSGGVKVTNSSIVQNIGNHTLYAQWENNVFTITLDNQGANNAGSTKIYQRWDDRLYEDENYTLISEEEYYHLNYEDLERICGDTMCKITTPTKENYVFAGYYTKPNGKGTRIIDELGFLTGIDDSKFFEKDATIYAYWLRSVKLTYDANGGTYVDSSGNTVSIGTTSVAYGLEYNELPTPTRDNYIFLGWSMSKENIDIINVNTVVDLTEPYTLYAIWTLNNGVDYVVTSKDGEKGVTATKPLDFTSTTLTIPGVVYTSDGTELKVFKIGIFFRDYNAPKAQIVNIGNNVYDIDTYAFNFYSNSISSFVVDSNNPYFSSENGVLYNKDKTTIVFMPAAKTGTYKMPNTVVNRYSDKTFQYTKLSEIYFGSNFRGYGGYWTIYQAYNLKAIYVDSNNPYYSDIDGILYNKAQTTLLKVPETTSGTVTLPRTLKSISTSAFRGCSKVTTVNIYMDKDSIKPASWDTNWGATNATFNWLGTE